MEIWDRKKLGLKLNSYVELLELQQPLKKYSKFLNNQSLDFFAP